MQEQISYYELLGLIIEKKQPDKIKYDGSYYDWDGVGYYTINGDELIGLNEDLVETLYDTELINKKCIEIIQPEEEFEEIKELDVELLFGNYEYDKKLVSTAINQLIRNQNKIIKKLEKKDE